MRPAAILLALYPFLGYAAEPPEPTRTPTEAQLRVAITRDLWAEVLAWRALGAQCQRAVPQQWRIGVLVLACGTL